MNASNYGPLALVVASVGFVISAAYAVLLTIFKRFRWEPATDDELTHLWQGSRYVTAAVAGVVIVLFFIRATPANTGAYTWISVAAGVVLLAAVLVYSGRYVTGTMRRPAVKNGVAAETQERVIIGSELTPDARTEMEADPHLPEEKLFAGRQYRPELVWTKRSRARNLQTFILLLFLINISAVSAVTAVALLISSRMTPPAQTTPPPADPAPAEDVPAAP